jgi:hypothetical protein
MSKKLTTQHTTFWYNNHSSSNDFIERNREGLNTVTKFCVSGLESSSSDKKEVMGDSA